MAGSHRAGSAEGAGAAAPVGGDLLPVAARGHRAPPAPPRPGGVEEQSRAVGGRALADAPGERAAEQIDGVAGDRGQRAPTVALAGDADAAAQRGRSVAPGRAARPRRSPRRRRPAEPAGRPSRRGRCGRSPRGARARPARSRGRDARRRRRPGRWPTSHRARSPGERRRSNDRRHRSPTVITRSRLGRPGVEAKEELVGLGVGVDVVGDRLHQRSCHGHHTNRCRHVWIGGCSEPRRLLASVPR